MPGQAHAGNTNFKLAREDFGAVAGLPDVSKDVMSAIESELKKLKVRGAHRSAADSL